MGIKFHGVFNFRNFVGDTHCACTACVLNACARVNTQNLIPSKLKIELFTKA